MFTQVNSDVQDGFPILVLNENKRLVLLPPLSPQKESPDSEVSPFSSEKSYACSDSEFPFGKWVHVGCQVCISSVWITLLLGMRRFYTRVFNCLFLLS